MSETTGWSRVGRAISDLRLKIDEAQAEEEFQAVGLLCREALISASQLVYDAARHPVLDGVTASATDAKRMLEAYLAVELAGGPNEEARRHAKAALDLASALQHRRTATFRDASLCVEATTSVVNIVAIISGRHSVEVAGPLTLLIESQGEPPNQVFKLTANEPLTLSRLEYMLSDETCIVAKVVSLNGQSFGVPLDQDALTELMKIPRADRNLHDGSGPVKFAFTISVQGRTGRYVVPARLTDELKSTVMGRIFYRKITGSRQFNETP